MTHEIYFSNPFKHAVTSSTSATMISGGVLFASEKRPYDRRRNAPIPQFGRVVLDDAALAVAAGANHVLVMTSTKVSWIATHLSTMHHAFSMIYSYATTLGSYLILIIVSN